MKNHRLIMRALVLVLIATWMTGTLQARGSDLNLKASQSVSGQASVSAASPLGTAFTYQGQLKDGSGNPVSNTCNFQFNLYDAASSGNLVGNSPQTATGVVVTNGYFTVSLDFGNNAFTGPARWLQVAVKCGSDSSFTPLSSRQPLTPAPYALYSASAGNADTLDGLHAATFEKHHGYVVTVAKVGGDFNSISAAVNAIIDASAASPYLVYVAPGVYHEQVTMKPYISLEGAGESATTITWGGSNGLGGTVYGADYTELSNFTIANTGGAGLLNAVGIYLDDVSPRLDHLTINVTGSDSVSGSATGIWNVLQAAPIINDVRITAQGSSKWTRGILNYQANPTMSGLTVVAEGSNYNDGIYNDTCLSCTLDHSTLTATGGTNDYGIWNNNSSLTIQDSVISAAYGTNDGIHNNTAAAGSYKVFIYSSRVSANTSTIYTDTTSYTVSIATSQLTGNGGMGPGNYICFGSYDGLFQALSATCQIGG